MATMTRHDTTTTRPTWPERSPRDDTDTIDLRDERATHDEPRSGRDEQVAVRADRRPSMGWWVLRVVCFLLAIAILGAIALVAGLNTTDEVRIDAWVDTMRIPIWSVIAIAAAGGFVAGRLLDSRRR